MCEHHTRFSKSKAVAEAVIEAFHEPCRQQESGNLGSRRRKLWELNSETHCPLIGVCLPIAALKKIIGKELGYLVGADDYEFHVNAVAECRIRRPISEKIQRELDLRYATVIKRLSKLKSTQKLAASWKEAAASGTIADMLWATLSHPCCDEALRQQICRDVHMFQHQAGAGARADLNRLAKLREENAELLGQLFQVRERHAHDIAQRDALIQDLQSQLAQLRGSLVARTREADHMRAQLVELKSQIPDLPERQALLQRLEEQKSTIQQLKQAAARDKHVQETEAAPDKQLAANADDKDELPALKEGLRNKSVLCVGGRVAAVPMYRQLVECSGARFLHHDGGEEDASRQLEANLAAADLVICQTGCVSHGAYWRVKDYCKRTGKQCVFVDKPSASSLARCLRDLESGTETQVKEKGRGAFCLSGKQE